jgi:4-hydroxy-tetrahydrodipicolinate reductase
MTIRVGVIGAGGRMGSTVCAAVAADPALHLVAAIDQHAAGELRGGVAVSGALSTLTDERADVAVDFTVADATRSSALWLADNGIHAVIGTSGLDDDDVESFRGAFKRSNCLVAANFAIGAVLMMRFAELAAPLFETAEIVEMHHDGKTDAPSGTAMATAARMATASDTWAPDPTEHDVLEGARGGSGPAGIHVHSLRLRGMVAHQEVILGTTGQTLTIRHDSYDRSSFMPGVVLACKRIGEHEGVTVGLDAFLGL